MDNNQLDSNKYLWIQCEKEGYKLVKLLSIDNETAIIEDNNNIYKCCKSNVQQAHYPLDLNVNDMVQLYFLNEASVLHNLKIRYYQGIIYTYSGLFLIVFNPYCDMNFLYTKEIMNQYRYFSSQQPQLPPHLFEFSQRVLTMLSDKDQSILCTGESGAGKTECTRQVIRYLTFISTNVLNHSNDLDNANTILEAFGNAKTLKNDNSSRFGKFIRITFDANGKCHQRSLIETYLLEKSRVTMQLPGEGSFHVFYSVLKSEQMQNEFQMRSFNYLLNDECKNDEKALDLTDLVDLMIKVGIKEIESIIRTLIAILMLGNVFDQENEILKETELASLCNLLNVPLEEMTEALLTPTFKVNKTEFIVRSQNSEQIKFSLASLARSLYEKIFDWLVQCINEKGEEEEAKLSKVSDNFIGIVDIAGFEIFQENSFEQLCINLTNERLQQLFNHSMFICEQKLYSNEGIKWDQKDYGIELQPVIDLIENKIFPLLDEECKLPKTTNKTLAYKLNSHLHLDNKFIKESDLESDQYFTIIHYAGRVKYCLKNWICKNTDPDNKSVTRVLCKSTSLLMRKLWAKDSDNTNNGLSRTVSYSYKKRLSKLIEILKNTNTNFIRCIIPNYLKKPKMIDSILVLNQLRCNGVMEGIRICTEGYPGRISYSKFKTKYFPLIFKINDSQVDKSDRMISEQILAKAFPDDQNCYKLGKTRVFFKSNTIAKLDKILDTQMNRIILGIQSLARKKLADIQFKQKQKLKDAILIIQKNARIRLKIKQWSWWKLYCYLKPIIKINLSIEQSEELKLLNEEIKKIKNKINDQDKLIQIITNENAQIQNKCSELSANDLEPSCEILRREIDFLTNQLDNLNDKVINLNTLNSSKEKYLNEERKNLAKSEQEFKEQIQQNSKVSEEIQNVSRLKQQLLDKINEINAKIEETTLHLNKNQNSIQTIEQKHLDYLEEINQKENLNSELQLQIKNLKDANETNNADSAKLQFKINEYKTKQDEINEKITIRNKEIADLKRNIRQIENELKPISKNMQKMKSIAQEKAIELESFNLLFNNTTKDIEIEQKSRLCKEKEKERLSRQNESYRLKISDHNKTRIIMQKKLQTTEEEIDSVNNLLNEQSIKITDSLKCLINDQMRNRKEKTTIVQSIQKENFDLKSELSLKNERINVATDELEKQMKERENQLSLIEKASYNLSANQKKLCQLENDKKSIQQQLQSTHVLIEQIKEATTNILTKQKSTTDLTEENLSQINSHKQQIQAEIQKQNDLLKSQKDLNHQIQRLNNELAIVDNHLKQKEKHQLELENEIFLEIDQQNLLQEANVNRLEIQFESERKRLKNELQLTKNILFQNTTHLSKLENDLEDERHNMDRLQTKLLKLQQHQSCFNLLKQEIEKNENLKIAHQTSKEQSKRQKENLLDMTLKQNELNVTCERLVKEIDKTNDKMYEIKREETERLQNVQILKNKIRALEDELSGKATKIEYLQSAINDVDLDRIQIQKNYDNLKINSLVTNLDDKRYESIKNRIGETKAEIIQLRDSDDTQIQIYNLKTKAKELERMKFELEKSNDNDDKKIERISKIGNDKIKELEQMKNACKEIQTKQIRTKNRCDYIQTSLLEQERQLRDSLNSKFSMIDELNSKRDEIESCRANNQKEVLLLKIKADELEECLQQKQFEREIIQNKIKNISKLSNDINDKNFIERQTNKNTIQNLKLQLEELKAKLSDENSNQNKSEIKNLEIKYKSINDQFIKEQEERRKSKGSFRQLNKEAKKVKIQLELNSELKNTLYYQLTKTKSLIVKLENQILDENETINTINVQLNKTKREMNEINEIAKIKHNRLKQLECMCTEDGLKGDLSIRVFNK